MAEFAPQVGYQDFAGNEIIFTKVIFRHRVPFNITITMNKKGNLFIREMSSIVEVIVCNKPALLFKGYSPVAFSFKGGGKFYCIFGKNWGNIYMKLDTSPNGLVLSWATEKERTTKTISPEKELFIPALQLFALKHTLKRRRKKLKKGQNENSIFIR